MHNTEKGSDLGHQKKLLEWPLFLLSTPPLPLPHSR